MLSSIIPPCPPLQIGTFTIPGKIVLCPGLGLAALAIHVADLSRYHVDHSIADVGEMIGGPFQVQGDEHQEVGSE